MNNLLSYIAEDYASVFERYTFACRNYCYRHFESDYVRHRTLSQAISRPYLVTYKDTRLPFSFDGVKEAIFSTTEVLL